MYPYFFVKSGVDDETQKKNMFNFLLSQAIITSTVFLLTIFTFFDKKSSSKGQNENENKEKENKIPIKKQLKVLFSDIPYTGMLFSASLAFGAVSAIGVGINVTSKVFFNDEFFGSICVIVGLVSGILSSIVYSIFWMHNPKQLRNFQITMVISVVSMLLIMVCLYGNQKVLALLVVVFYCSSNLVSFPILVEQITERLSGGYVALGTGIIYFLTQLFIAAFSYLIGEFIFYLSALFIFNRSFNE